MTPTYLTGGDDGYTAKSSLEYVDGFAGLDTITMGGAAAGKVSARAVEDGFLMLSVDNQDRIAIRNIEKVVFTDVTYELVKGGWVASYPPAVPGFVNLTAGDDIYADKPGAELIDGLAGYDTYTFNASAAALNARSNADGSLTLTLDNVDVATIRNIEKVVFTDVTFLKAADGSWSGVPTTSVPAATPAITQLTTANDVYIDVVGVEKVDGLAGSDTVEIRQSVQGLNAVTTADGFLAISLNGNDVIEIRNVEHVKFLDQSFSQDALGNWFIDPALGFASSAEPVPVAS